MGIELPMVVAIMARLDDAEVQLAAYGGVVFPLALIIEAPIIMLLAASTQLSRDAASYRSLRRFTQRIGLALTIIHVLLAFTPLYDHVVIRVLEVPAEVVEPARVGLMIMTPWTWAIAYRRFEQGALIRFGQSRAVTVGTLFRLGGNASVLGLGYVVGTIPGIVVGTAAMSTAVVIEAIYAGIRVRPVVREHLSTSDPDHEPLRGRRFLDFYVPLAMTPLIVLAVQPIGAAAISRMPDALSSLAVWPTITGLAFMFQSVGLAYNEVVVALLGQPGAKRALRRFVAVLSVGTGLGMLLFVVTPLGELWFGGVSGLSAPLTAMACGSLWITLPVAPLRAVQSWHQGLLVYAQRTRAITESVLVFLAVCVAVLWFGVRTQAWVGLDVALVGFSVGRFAQTMFLWWRSVGELRRGEGA